MPQLEIREALYAQLMLIPEVVAIIGTRAYPAKKEQDAAFPHVIYWKIHEKRLSCFTKRTGNAFASFVIDCWAQTPDEAAALSRAIRGRGTNANDPTLDFFQGQFGGNDGLMVQHAEVEDMEDDEDHRHDNRPQQGDDVGVFRTSLAFEVFFNEA